MAAAKSTATKTAAETPEAAGAAAVQTPEGHVDRVATPTLRADGTPLQSEGWVRLVDERDSAEA